MGCLLQNPPLWDQGSMQKRWLGLKEPKGWVTPVDRTVSLGHHGTDAHVHSRRLAARIGPAQVWARQVPAGRGGRRHGLPFLTKNLPPADNHEQRKIKFSPMESHWVCSGHLRAGPMPSNRKPAQNELNSVIVDFWSHRAVFWTFLVFWLYIVVSNFVFMSFVRVSCAFLLLIKKYLNSALFFCLFVCLFVF